MTQRTRSAHGLSVRARSAALLLFFVALGLTPLHAAAAGGGKAAPKARRVNPGQIGEWSAITPSPKATVVAIHTSVLPDGRILFWGANAAGTTSAQIWNPATNALVSANYVGASLFCGGHSFLPDGRLLVTGGQTTLLAGIPNTTIFDYATNTWTDTGKTT